MNIIFLDSSSKELAIGLVIDGVIVESIVKQAWQRQSELMIPELDQMLKKHHIDRHAINEVVVGIGPGSFTGVRISLTIAKVMAKVLNIPLFAVSSLRIRKFKNVGSICVLNARSNRSYVGVYKGGEIIVNDTIMSNEEVLNYIKEHKEFVLCGEAEHLNLESVNGNIIEEMLDLKKHLIPVAEVNGLAPVYLKD